MAHPPLPQHFSLTPQMRAEATALEEVNHQLSSGRPSGVAVLNCRDRRLTLPELRAIQGQLAAAGLELQTVEASEPLTLVPAAALGLATNLQPAAVRPINDGSIAAKATALSIHRGTLRAGDHLEVDGSLLVLGDVNPGARVSAAGDVRIWGRLRGVAHAGCRGDRTARIVAMQLRPVQLRIAEALARGPEDQPPAGFCEEAVLVNGQIAIRPAQPSWPQEQPAGEGRSISD